ncbi:DUF6339 family protein [Ramlibacter sp. AN1133]|uniref:DUF6339 family protein n=1 Tax=Ramlibacter sp. AN1133 TaxID=3133429 RepID=UPI0030BAACA3
MSAPDASIYLTAKRNGAPFESEGLVKTKGSGVEFDTSFVEELRAELAAVQARWPNGLKNDGERNTFEGTAARLVHSVVPCEPEVLSDPEFWIWLAVVSFPDVIEWRYGNKHGGTKPANYGIGSKTENLLYRLWLRAELVLDEQHEDRYHLADAGQIDFYRSHLFRQGYANARTFARALLRFQYPKTDSAPNLKILEIRELVKRLRRLRANLFLEILPEEECRAVIESEAAVVLAA